MAHTDSSIRNPIVPALPQNNSIQTKAEQRQAFWYFCLSLGLIAGTIAVSAGFAHWLTPLP